MVTPFPVPPTSYCCLRYPAAAIMSTDFILVSTDIVAADEIHLLTVQNDTGDKYASKLPLTQLAIDSSKAPLKEPAISDVTDDYTANQFRHPLIEPPEAAFVRVEKCVPFEDIAAVHDPSLDRECGSLQSHVLITCSTGDEKNENSVAPTEVDKKSDDDHVPSLNVNKDQILDNNVSPFNEDQIRDDNNVSPLNEDQIRDDNNVSPLNEDQIRDNNNVSPLKEDQIFDNNVSPLDEDQIRDDNNVSPLNEDQVRDDNVSPLKEDQIRDNNVSPLNEDQVRDDNVSPLNEDQVLNADYTVPNEPDDNVSSTNNNTLLISDDEGHLDDEDNRIDTTRDSIDTNVSNAVMEVNSDHFTLDNSTTEDQVDSNMHVVPDDDTLEVPLPYKRLLNKSFSPTIHLIRASPSKRTSFTSMPSKSHKTSTKLVENSMQLLDNSTVQVGNQENSNSPWPMKRTRRSMDAIVNDSCSVKERMLLRSHGSCALAQELLDDNLKDHIPSKKFKLNNDSSPTIKFTSSGPIDKQYPLNCMKHINSCRVQLSPIKPFVQQSTTESLHAVGSECVSPKKPTRVSLRKGKYPKYLDDSILVSLRKRTRITAPSSSCSPPHKQAGKGNTKPSPSTAPADSKKPSGEVGKKRNSRKDGSSQSPDEKKDDKHHKRRKINGSSDESSSAIKDTWKCAFCGFGNNAKSLGYLFGPYEINCTKDGIKEVWMHSVCAMWAPSVCLVRDELKNLQEVIEAGKSIVCSSCKLPGATLSCHLHSCKRPFHYPCAFEKGCIFNLEQFTITCQEHTT